MQLSRKYVRLSRYIDLPVFFFLIPKPFDVSLLHTHKHSHKANTVGHVTPNWRNTRVQGKSAPFAQKCFVPPSEYILSITCLCAVPRAQTPRAYEICGFLDEYMRRVSEEVSGRSTINQKMIQHTTVYFVIIICMSILAVRVRRHTSHHSDYLPVSISSDLFVQFKTKAKTKTQWYWYWYW